MNPNAVNDETLEPLSTTHSDNDSSVLKDAGALWQTMRGLGYAHLRLAALETQRAGQSFVVMLIAAVMAAVLLNGAWLAFCATVAARLIEQGVSISSALLLALAFNLLAALVCLIVIRRKSRYLRFPALLKSLEPQSATPKP